MSGTRGGFYKYRKPREARGGIKARTARGHAFASNWWSRRWIEVMEESIDAGRLARGKSYARKGQVVGISIEPGLVTACVQGSRKTPYQVRFGIETISGEAREMILFRFRENAAFAARLLAGELPEETEEIFKDAKAPLFPTKSALRRFKCSCPDDAAPCKHIVAVLLLLGEEISDDPFLLLKLRGLEKESLINMLTLESARDEEIEARDFGEACELSGGAEASESAAPPMEGEELPADENWFRGGEFSFERAETDNRRRAAALEVMNDFPFWRGEHPFRQTLAPIYEQAATYAGEILTGEKKKPIGRPRKMI